jgi:hypothetical protein
MSPKLDMAAKFSKRIRAMMKQSPSAMYAIASMSSGVDAALPGGTGETVRVFRKHFPNRPIYVYNYTEPNEGWWMINRVPYGDDRWPWVPLMDAPPPPKGIYLAAGTTSHLPQSVTVAVRELYGLDR